MSNMHRKGFIPNEDLPERSEVDEDPEAKGPKFKSGRKDAFNKTQIGPFMTSLPFVLSALFVYFYQQSLEGGPNEIWLHKNLGRIAVNVLLSVIAFVASNIISLRLENAKLRWGVRVFNIIAMSMLFVSDLGTNAKAHGLYNALGFIFLATPSLMGFFATRACFQCCGVSKTIVGLVLVLFVSYLALQVRFGAFRDEWRQGLFGVSLEYKKPGCSIEPPVYNWMAATPERSFNFFLSMTCSPQEQFSSLSPSGFLDFSDCKEPITVTELPRTLEYTLEMKANESAICKAVLQEFQTDAPKPHYPDAEALLVTCGNKRNLHVRAARNQSYVARSKEILKQQSLSTKPNVLVIILDAVSRRHFIRRMPKTVKFLEETTSYDVYQFMRYHSIGIVTVTNGFPLYMGSPAQNLSMKMIWEDYKAKGYVTANVDENPEDFSAKHGRISEWDHQLITPWCLPDYVNPNRPFNPFHGPYSMAARCIAGRFAHEYVFDYVHSFWKNYKDVPKFMIATLLEGHEGSGDVIGTVDSSLADFLQEMSKDQNTLIFLGSDHGLHMGVYFAFQFTSVLQENQLPAFYPILPKWFKEKYPTFSQHMKSNEQTLVTHYDMHGTLKFLSDLPNLPSEAPGTLFSVLPDRTCEEAQIPPEKCMCKAS